MSNNYRPTDKERRKRRKKGEKGEKEEEGEGTSKHREQIGW